MADLPDPMEDSELVRRALARDQQAFAALYDRYADRLHDYALRQTRHEADAADIVQDTFVLAIQRLHQLRDPTLVRPWLYAIARSEVHRRYRHINRLQFTEPDEQAAMKSTEPTADDLVHQAELRTLFTEAANGLDPGDREVLDLHLRHSLTAAEISSTLGIPERQVSVVLQRVRERLGRSIGVVLMSRNPSCPDLQALQRTEGTPLTVLGRKRLARHIDTCATCSEQLQRRMRPEVLLAVVPFALAPAFLRAGVLRRMVDTAGTAPTSTDTLPRREGARTWHEADGFPRLATHRRGMTFVLGAAASLLLLAFVALVATGGDSARRTTARTDPQAVARTAGDPATTTTILLADTPSTVGTAASNPTGSSTPAPTVPPNTVAVNTAPPATAPDSSAPVFQSISASRTALSTANDSGDATCLAPSDLTSLISVDVTDDRSVASVTATYGVAGLTYDVALAKVGDRWQAVIGPFPAPQVPPGLHQINASFTATDAAGNSRSTTANNLATVLGCQVIL